MDEGVQLALGVARQVGALGQVVAQQAIGVLVGAAFPRAMRICKEHPDREPMCLKKRGHLNLTLFSAEGEEG